MQTISGFPYFEVQFNKEGGIHNEDEVTQILNFLPEGHITDLFVISHGWNNNIEQARSLYKSFFAQIRTEINNNRPLGIEQRKFAVLGILWPSMKFAEKELIASGAAGLGQTEEEELVEWLESLKGTFDNPDADARIEKAKQLVNLIRNDTDAGRELIDLIRSLPHKNEIHPDDASDQFFTIPGDTLVDILSRPDLPVATEESGGAAAFDPSIGSSLDAGGALGFNIFGGITSAIRKVLNFTTYYQMKERAGVVGRTGAYQALQKIRKTQPALKVHLIGHSFGGRLVTALADGPADREPVVPESVTLLQAAFSHNGFAENFDGNKDGFFRKVVSEKKVKGPVLISHTVKDLAVGIAYAVASKLSGVDAAEFGGPQNRFGGIGRNGAQSTPEAENSTPLGPVTTQYTFQAGKLYNLKADTIILGHSDIVKAEIAHAVLSAVASV